MKKILLLIATILFVGCQQPMDTDVIGIVKSSDEKTQIILSDLENYLAYGTDQYDAELPANLVTMDLAGNFADQSVDYEAFLAVAEQHHSLFDNIQMGVPGGDTPGVIQTVYYDEPYGTWSHYWGLWSATGKITGNETSQFIHLNWQWDDNGNIISHNIHVDGKDILGEMAAAEASGSE